MSQNPIQSQPAAAAQAVASAPQQQKPMGGRPFAQQSGQIQENLMMQMVQAHGAQRHNQGHPDSQRPREPREKKPSVYVGNLPKDYYQLDLFKHVKGLGFAILNAYIKVDRNTKRQNRYGFLTFHTMDEAKRAAKDLNNTIINGSSIRCNVQEDNFNDPKSNVYVKNIDPTVTQQQLHDAFLGFGDIVSCKLETFTDGRSRGFGYVQFKTQEQAEAAIEKGQIDMNGKSVDVLAHKKKDERNATEQKTTNVFVQGIPKGSTDTWLQQKFGEFGEITSACVQRSDSDDFLSNKGYVSFKDSDSATQAIEALNKADIGEGHYLLVGPHISQRETQVAATAPGGNPIQKQLRQTFQSNLFVKNVPSEVSEQELSETFEGCGPVMSIKMRQGKHFNPGAAYRQYFVLYKEVDDAKKAIQKYDHSTPFGSYRPLSVQFWMPSSELHQERESRSQQEVQQYFFRSLYQPGVYGDQRPMRGQDGQYQPNMQNRGDMQQRRQYGDGKPQGRGGYHNKQGGQGRGGPRNGPYQDRRGPRMQGDGTQGQQPMGAPQQQPGQMLTPEQQIMYQQQQQQQNAQQMQMMQMQQQQQPQMQPLVPMEIFGDQVDPNVRKNTIGNAIFPIIQQNYKDAANKITGMLLDNDKVVDQQALVTNQMYLMQKAHEAFTLLTQSMQQQPEEGQPQTQ